jgi:hypothetical protein
LELKQFLPIYQNKMDLLPLDQLKILLVSGLDPLYLAPLKDIFLNKQSSTIDFNDKPDDLPQCFNNSIQTSNNDTNTNPSNQYEMRRDNLKKFATLSRANTEYNYLQRLTLTLKLPNRNVMTKFG